MNERELIAKAKDGDDTAFEQLVRSYEKKVYATAYRYMGSEQDALDVSQDVFIRVFRFIKSFNEESSFSTWIYRITVNVCKDYIKKRQQRSELPLEVVMGEDEDDIFVNEISDSTYDPAEVFERAELSREIRKGIEELPDNYREIIIMRDLSDLSYEEIADALSIEIGTVKSRLARAREKLRKKLLQNGNKLPISRSKS